MQCALEFPTAPRLICIRSPIHPTPETICRVHYWNQLCATPQFHSRYEPVRSASIALSELPSNTARHACTKPSPRSGNIIFTLATAVSLFSTAAELAPPPLDPTLPLLLLLPLLLVPVLLLMCPLDTPDRALALARACRLRNNPWGSLSAARRYWALTIKRNKQQKISLWRHMRPQIFLLHDIQYTDFKIKTERFTGKKKNA